MLFFSKPKINSNLFFAFIFIYSMVMPFFYNKMGSSGVVFINASLIVFVFFYLMLSKCFRFRDIKNKRNFCMFFSLLLFFCALIPVSTFIGVFFGEVNLIFRDFFEFYRPFLYILVFVFSYFYFLSTMSLAVFEKVLLFVFIIIITLGLNHFLGLSDIVTELYTKDKNIQSRRVSAPFVNPYDYAFFMTFFVYYFFMKFLFHKKIYFLFFVFSVVMLILPQSRSVVAGFLVSFFLFMPAILTYFGVSLRRLSVQKNIFLFYIFFFFIVFSFMLSIPYLLDNFRYLTGQFVRLLERGEVGNSAGIRIEQFIFALNKALNNPLIMLFGNGPSKYELEYVESIYNYLFYRYGLLGLVSYFFFLSLGIYSTFKIVKNLGAKHRNYSLFLTILLWFITIPLLSIGNNFTEQVRLSFFYYMLMGLVAVSYYRFVIKGERS